MVKENKLIKDFYELKVSQLMDKRMWDLPLIEENEDIHHVLSILGARNHIWVIKNKNNADTFVRILQNRAELSPGKIAFSFIEKGGKSETPITYYELDRQARSIAAHLQSQKFYFQN